MAAAILGLGHHLPPLVERNGRNRPLALNPVGPSELAVPAVRTALAHAGINESEVDLLVFATMSPDVTFPGAGCFLQRHLDFGTIGALDVRAQCAGFLYAMAVANDFIETGAYSSILVIGGEVHSSALDYSPRGEAVAALFGDGAGAMLLGRGGESRRIHAVTIGCEGSQHDRFWCEFPASRQHPIRFTAENFDAGQHFPKIDFDAVRASGLRRLPEAISTALDQSERKADEVDCFILSHVFPDVAAAAGAACGVEDRRMIVPSIEHGHLTAAALPVALSQASADGRIGSGSTVCLAAAGAGFCWGAAVVTL